MQVLLQQGPARLQSEHHPLLQHCAMFSLERLVHLERFVHLSGFWQTSFKGKYFFEFCLQVCQVPMFELQHFWKHEEPSLRCGARLNWAETDTIKATSEGQISFMILWLWHHINNWNKPKITFTGQAPLSHCLNGITYLPIE